MVCCILITGPHPFSSLLFCIVLSTHLSALYLLSLPLPSLPILSPSHSLSLSSLSLSSSLELPFSLYPSISLSTPPFLSLFLSLPPSLSTSPSLPSSVALPLSLLLCCCPLLLPSHLCHMLIYVALLICHYLSLSHCSLPLSLYHCYSISIHSLLPPFPF